MKNVIDRYFYFSPYLVYSISEVEGFPLLKGLVQRQALTMKRCHQQDKQDTRMHQLVLSLAGVLPVDLNVE